MNNINWRNLLGLTGVLVVLANFAKVMNYIRSTEPFVELNALPPEQRNLVVLGIIITCILIVREIRKGR
ncbi:MAG: hypothetical protein AB7E95_07740 [Kiritimatiellales bacterium]